MSSFYSFLNNANLFAKFIDETMAYQRNSCNSFCMYYGSVFVSAIIPALIEKTQTVYSSFGPATLTNVLKAIEKRKCTSLVAGPKFLFDMLSAPDLLAKHDTSSLRYIRCGGQIVSIQLVRSAFAKWPTLKYFLIVFGMTEMLNASAMRIDNPHQQLASRYTSVSIGKPLPFFEFKIVEPASGRCVPVNTIGELYVRSYSTFIGYWDDEKKTREAIDEDKW
jgi:fatty-acyl-CoA synthase